MTNLANPLMDRLRLFEVLEFVIEVTTGARRRQDSGERPATIRQL